ncbi:hypothetical protein GCK72_008819 [Caenorhabditis remanei]|uniref:SH2 domain-containing protein n=1 Tax=Caenorhabditis remanei TaxID=31234 RepID=A0A6A5GYJ2_CAERE|nr:hypothetical protein GCK72_008819 [Caenorhabditis remanei]KAF1760570.1 hypothetical protein GCK72_008819 [Caenorhabditis remanei]
MTTTLSALPYYDGSIDIRECREMLPDLGDFLIRNVAQEVDKSDGKGQVYCILTTAVTPEQASDNSKMLPKEYSLRGLDGDAYVRKDADAALDSFTMHTASAVPSFVDGSWSLRRLGRWLAGHWPIAGLQPFNDSNGEEGDDDLKV